MSSKGEQTRQRVLQQAVRQASLNGLEGLTIGSLSSDVRMSKSGLFAHFGSKEQLQLAVLEEVAERFVERVVRPAFSAPRGLARIRALFDHHVAWNMAPEFPGGSVLLNAVHELGAQPGPLRDFLSQQQERLITLFAKAARITVEEGDFRTDLDVDQFAFEVFSGILGHHYYGRFLEAPDAERRARETFNRILQDAMRKAD